MKSVFSFLIALVTSQSLGVAQPLQLEDLLKEVKSSFPLIEGARRDVEAAVGEVRSTEGAFDLQWRTRFAYAPIGFYENHRLDSILEQPTTLWGTTVFAGYRLGLGKFAVYDGKAETNPGGEVRVGLNVPVFRDGPTDRRRANIAKAKFGVDVSNFQVTQQMIDTVRIATQRYWDWVVSGRRLGVFRTVLKIAQDRDAGLAERVKHGDLPVFDRRDNERAILQRQAQLVSAERSFQQAAIELSLYYRNASGEPVVLSEDRLPVSIPEPQTSEIPEPNLDKALAQRPDLSRLSALKSQNEIELSLAGNQMGPRLDLQVQGVQTVRRTNTFRDEAQMEAGVLLEIPLQVNVAGGREDVARATSTRIELQQRFLRDRIGTELRDAKSAIDAAIQRFRLTRQEVELAKKLEQGERVRFNQGESNILFVNIREQATVDAEVRELEALGDYRKNLATLRAALAEF